MRRSNGEWTNDVTGTSSFLGTEGSPDQTYSEVPYIVPTIILADPF